MVEFGVETVYSNAKISQFIQQKKEGQSQLFHLLRLPLFLLSMSQRGNRTKQNEHITAHFKGCLVLVLISFGAEEEI